MADEPQELELQAGDKKLKIRGSDWLSLFGVAVGVLVLYMVFEHKQDAKEGGAQFAGAVKEMVTAQKEQSKELYGIQREMVSAQREQNCLIAFTQDQRKEQAEFCKRMARDR